MSCRHRVACSHFNRGRARRALNPHIRHDPPNIVGSFNAHEPRFCRVKVKQLYPTSYDVQTQQAIFFCYMHTDRLSSNYYGTNPIPLVDFSQVPTHATVRTAPVHS